MRTAEEKRLHNSLVNTMIQHGKYRKLAFAHYDPVCAHGGFGISAVLEVAHLDCDRSNNDLSNLVILCPNCHKMYDLDLIGEAALQRLRAMEVDGSSTS